MSGVGLLANMGLETVSLATDLASGLVEGQSDDAGWIRLDGKPTREYAMKSLPTIPWPHTLPTLPCTGTR